MRFQPRLEAGVVECGAGGAGIPAFYTKTGVGTLIAEGKEVKNFDGQDYILERGIFANVIVVSSPELLLGILGQTNAMRQRASTADANAIIVKLLRSRKPIDLRFTDGS